MTPRRGRLPAPWTPRRVSKAVRLLQEAPTSPCSSCGRVTKTTSDGFCADCWARKEGHLRGTAAPPGWALRVLDALTFRRPRR
jgi:hypothetical protein